MDIQWKVDQIAGCPSACGYIVQEFNRVQTPPNALGIVAYEDMHYFEAWKVENGEIKYSHAPECDDRFCIELPSGEPCYILESFRKSLGTEGAFNFNGTVYWVPEKSELYSIVDEWSGNSIVQANGLKAASVFPEIMNVDYVFKRAPFIHTWNLIAPEKISDKLILTLDRCCKEKEKKDYEFLQGAAVHVLKGKYKYLVQKVLNK